jgi:ketosteroid isomerase-like protein
MSEALDALVRWYETLSPASLERIGDFYADDAYFRDPFNEVNGLPAIRKIMQDMFEKLENPHFVVEERITEGSNGFLVWRFVFSIRRRPMEIQGSTHLRFAADGRVSFHRDYWDAATELYAKLPVVGWFVRRLGSLFSS